MISLLFEIGLLLVGSLTTFILYCRRQSNQRPRYVQLTVLFMNISSILSLYYYLSLYMMVQAENTAFQNTVQTFSDLFFFLFDWVFFYQYLSASMLLPVLLDRNIDDQVYVERKKRAERIKYAITATFFVLLIAWLVICLIYPTIEMRTSINLLYLMETTYFVWCLAIIKQQLNNLEIDTKNGLL